MLNRHLIVIPLNKIKTQREFSQYYFENMYNRDNEPDSINFENKIIVFEDIDCMTDIVKKRNYNNIDDVDNMVYNNMVDNNMVDNNMIGNSTNKLLKKLIKKMKDDDKPNNIDKDLFNEIESDFMVINNNSTHGDDKLTLSYLLNIIDGIRETPGRILIITSNNYDTLDDALVRPGRIDFTLKMTNASVSTIDQMFNHYYGQSLLEYSDMNNSFNLQMLKDHILSPAEIVNIRLSSNTPDDFIKNNYFISSLYMNIIIVLLLILLIITETSSQTVLKRFADKDSYWHLFFGIVGYSMVAILYGLLLRQEHSLVLVSILWQASTIVLISLVSVFLYKEKLSIKQIIGILTVIFGAFLTVHN